MGRVKEIVDANMRFDLKMDCLEYQLIFDFSWRGKKRANFYRNYDPQKLENALDAVLKGSMSQHQAARVFGVPQGTIFNRLAKQHPFHGKKRRSNVGYKQYYNNQMETALKAVFDNHMTHKDAAVKFGVPRSTITRRLRQYISDRQISEQKDKTQHNS
ncbi:Hypothetical predicted protein [Mytilus galloprovincialis]|uniref:HTH psq-type domain-containing protein n=1 Tax=Mytilus galloprovincialis TaxID=29158 RepID=A0A8B6F232_MYTGA|nr:Hypothetical predicted protein [Mytilus galloprovincialis]